MQIAEKLFSFEIPDKWDGLVGVRKKARWTDLILLWEEEPNCSGLLVSLKCLKRELSRPDESTELLGTLRGGDGDLRYLYAVWGQEGAVSEANEDLYWRLRDQLWQVFESISPAEGYLWSAAGAPCG